MGFSGREECSDSAREILQWLIILRSALTDDFDLCLERSHDLSKQRDRAGPSTFRHGSGIVEQCLEVLTEPAESGKPIEKSRSLEFVPDGLMAAHVVRCRVRLAGRMQHGRQHGHIIGGFRHEDADQLLAIEFIAHSNTLLRAAMRAPLCWR